VTEQYGNDQLGVVTEGSFSAGLTVRLVASSAEDLQVGSFVVLEGDRHRYFSLVNDLQLRSTDPGVIADPPASSAFIRRALQGIHTYSAAVVRPSLVVEDSADLTGDPRPSAVRTIPGHFATLRQATTADFDLVFGRESKERFSIGSPIAMDVDVMIPIDLKKLIERSNGIFGQTGTGKSVLTRLVLFGLARSNLASSLIFDMHDEYASARSEKPDIPGLRDLFDSNRIKVYSLGTDNTRASYHLQIGMTEIRPADIELLGDELDLSDTFSATAYLLEKRYGDRWLSSLLDMSNEDVSDFCATAGASQSAVEALRRKLMYLESCNYVSRAGSSSAVNDILQHLLDGRHVIVQFGTHSRLRDYMLVANILTRRIHQRYTERVERTESRNDGSTVKPLVVVLEEAHKFLSPAAAKQSIFGTIAREMRKFGVSLLVVDQRPSGIDSEVMSQLGTRICGLLADESDIAAVLAGTGDRSMLRSLLGSLEPSRQCLVVGHAIPMPIVLHTRKYGFELGKLLEDEHDLAERGKNLLMAPSQRRV
jgi:uncharacterized protein